jgi:hypothetical protein
MNHEYSREDQDAMRDELQDEHNILTDEDEIVLLERMVAEEQQEDYGVWLSHSNFEDIQ